MIYLNVAFLVIRPTLNTIVKILINASPLVVNKYTSNGLFRACIDTIWRLECTTCSINTIYALNNWSLSLDEHLSTDVVYFDFSKAFDSVPHARLLLKLQAYGINGQLLKWFESFLTGRRQCVKINSASSSWTQVSSGVPQGSVLGPLLFVLYINELPSLVSSQLLMFADDIKLYRCIRSPKDCLILQNDINILLD